VCDGVDGDDASTPEPDSATEAVVEPETSETVPATLPFAIGSNTTTTDSDWPGSSVSPDSWPITLNPEPVTAPRVVVSAEFPSLVNFKLSEPLLPTITLPKAIAVGLAPSCPVAVTPPPDSGTVTAIVLPEELKSTDAEPVLVPVFAGLKATLNVELLPAAICRPLASPDRLKPVPEIESEETDTVVLP